MSQGSIAVGNGLSGGRGVADVIQSSPPVQRYERTGEMIVHPVRFKESAYDQAILLYAQYPELSFEDDLIDYMRTGFVCSRPTIFFMAKVICEKGEHMWFVRIAVGNLLELLVAMPFYLPRIAFCRNNRADKMRICDVQRLCHLAVKLFKKGET